MKISSIYNSTSICDTNKNSSGQMICEESISSQSRNDSVSFSGRYIRLKGYLEDINTNKFPKDLYLREEDAVEYLKKKVTPLRQWTRFRYKLAELFAKRCKHLGIIDNPDLYSIGDSPRPSYGHKRTHYVRVVVKHEDWNETDIAFNWTRQYVELENFFKNKNTVSGKLNDIKVIKKNFYEILKRQGWMK